MIGATFCSGIGAPEVAAPFVDWRLASEIERFPRAVLSHRFGFADARYSRPDRFLWPDMTALRVRHMRRLGIPMPDLIVAGTPCQAFSFAGKRRSLADARGNLTLEFLRFVHAVRKARIVGRGGGGDLFSGGLFGKTCPEFSPQKTMHSAVSWADLSAQVMPCLSLVGRNGRVLVWLPGHGHGLHGGFSTLNISASPNDASVCLLSQVLEGGGDPAAILFERRGVQGDSPPRRKTGQEIAGTLDERVDGGCGFGGNNSGGPIDVAPTLLAKAGTRLDFASETLIAFSSKDYGGDALVDQSPTIRAGGHASSHANSGIPPAVSTRSGVRRLTVRECARLQGFPDNHTCIPGYGGAVFLDAADRSAMAAYLGFSTVEAMEQYAPPADGPQYKAYGNSMAVPVMRWILSRIAAAEGVACGG